MDPPRYVTEAWAWARLEHPNILAVYDVLARGEALFLVLEAAEGKTLRSRSFDPDDLRAFAIQAAQALDCAHHHGVLHRALTPKSFRLGPSRRLKIWGFGTHWLELSHAVTVAEELPPGCSFMSPEQARGEEVDGRTDIYSLGLVLYTLASGRNPFVAPTLPGLVQKILTETPPVISSVSQRTGAAILQCLHKDPAARFRSGAELLDALYSKPIFSPSRGEAELHRRRAANYCQSGMWDLAVLESHKALALDESDVVARNNLGVALLHMGKLLEALQEFKRAQELRPKNRSVVWNLGFALASSKLHQEAAEAFRVVALLDPRWIWAYQCRGRVLLQLGLTDQAIEEFHKALVLNPLDGSLYLALAQAHERKGKIEEADAYREKGLELQPSEVPAPVLLDESAELETLGEPPGVPPGQWRDYEAPDIPPGAWPGDDQGSVPAVLPGPTSPRSGADAKSFPEP